MNSSVVVTGAARGIGRGIAERMVARGHRVVLTDIDGDAAAATASEIGAAEGLRQDVGDPALAPRGGRGGRAPRRTPGVVQQRRHRRRRGAGGPVRGAGTPAGRGQPARHAVGHARGDRGVRRPRRRRREHRVAVRAGAGPRLQRVRRHEGRDRLGVDVGRRGDPAQRPGARAVPRRRPDRDARRPDARARSRPGWSTPAAGSSPSTRSPRRPSTWSAATAWC